MERWDSFLRQARHCHTKQAWEELILPNSELVVSCHSSKPLHLIFKLICQDPQFLKYEPSIFGILIRATISCWDLELGRQICHATASINAPDRTIPATQLFLDLGKPTIARTIAQRSLRLKNLSTKDRCQLQIYICNSFVEEGKNAKAAKYISGISLAGNDQTFTTSERASTNVQLARLEFFLGRYQQAFNYFEQASNFFLELQDWESAAKALFNTAACSQNAGDAPIHIAFRYVEKSRMIAEKFDLRGPLSHCEAFYGLDSFQHGNFVEAHDHFRRALSFLPASDKSYRRLHILSMLSLTYLASGRHHLARKFGRQTLELAQHDNSERHRSRYNSLNAELLWENGELAKSQQCLEKENIRLSNAGIHTLEDFSSHNRYLLQTAHLGLQTQYQTVKMNEHLHHQFFTHLDFEYAVAAQLMIQKKYKQALQAYNGIEYEATQRADKFHQTLAKLGEIQVSLKSPLTDEQELLSLATDFEILVRRMGNTSLTPKVGVIRAAIAYKKGDIKECERHLRVSARSNRLNYTDRYTIGCWLNTFDGRSCRIHDLYHRKLLANQTRKYFSPSLEIRADNMIVVSGNHIIDLSRHRAILDLLKFLSTQPNYSAYDWEIQTEVWKQSLNSLGWKQKIRNTIMRTRDCLRNTMAPVIVHSNQIQLYSEAIKIYPQKPPPAQRKEDIYRLLKDHELTAIELSQRLQTSRATTKRELKQLLAQGKISSHRKGRNIFYYTNSI